jgi:hypothetical protein
MNVKPIKVEKPDEYTKPLMAWFDNFALQMDNLIHDVLRKQKPMGPSARILAALRRGPITSHDLHRLGGYNPTARISNLRDAGHDIRCVHMGNRIYRYVLDEEPIQLCAECDQPKLGDLGCGCEEAA